MSESMPELCAVAGGGGGAVPAVAGAPKASPAGPASAATKLVVPVDCETGYNRIIRIYLSALNDDSIHYHIEFELE
uniref:Uncharacterized protein n=1 Tax=Pristionchus pacificus TaxID=54126 RepID=A0A2A6BT22_PRIPA|eukprot:PDM69089.1 hypothetical protein PRIPAC_47391 [Pristionchus pacificus]